MIRSRRTGLLVAASLALAPNAAVLAETVAITNGTLLTQGPQGDVARGTIVIKDGRIAAVGPGVTAPAGARIVDAAGKIVTPGFINPASNNGSMRPSSFNDIPATDDAPLTNDIALAFNPANVDVLESAVDGETSAVLVPAIARAGIREGKIFAGGAALVEMSGRPDSLIRKGLGPVFSLSAASSVGGREGAYPRLVRQLRAARGGGDKSPPPAPDADPLKAVLAGSVPLLVEVDRASDILHILDIAQTEKIRVILLGVAEGWLVAPQIARAGVPVIIGDGNLPADMDSLNATYQNAARLKAAGVAIVLEGEGILGPAPRTARSPRFVAGRSVAYGLDRKAALEAITIAPARAWGVQDEVGSIEAGKRADLVIWSGDPLEVTTMAEHVFIAGAEPPPPRAALLRDKYKALMDAAPTGAGAPHTN